MSIVQRYVKATNSSSLADDELHHDTEALAAMALASNIGSLLFRIKYAGDQMSLKPLLIIWRIKIADRAKHRGWSGISEEVADISLWHWMEDFCPECNGLGHPKMPKAPTLEAMTCPACNGTGKKKLKCHAEIYDHVMDVVAWLDRLTAEAASNFRYKLGD